MSGVATVRGAQRSPHPAARGGTQATAATAPAPIVVWKNLGVLRGLAISLVVLSHSMRPQGNFVYGSGFLDRELYFGLFHFVLVNVPIFVFVSGYFMARFSATWPAARAGARLVLGRYALWTFVHFAVLWAVLRHLELGRTLWSIVSGTGRPHWFLILLVQLYLCTPLLLPVVKRFPRRTVAAALVLEVLACAVYALRRAGIDTGIHLEFLPMQLPFYLLGMLASIHSEAITGFLGARRRAVHLATGAALLLAWIETRTIHALQPDVQIVYQTPGLMIMALMIVAWAWAQPSESTRLRAALNWIGLRSFGVLLAHDYVVRGVTAALWHFERVLGLTTRPRGEPPLWIFAHVWSVVPLFVIGLAVPLLAIEAVERIAGKRARTVVFG